MSLSDDRPKTAPPPLPEETHEPKSRLFLRRLAAPAVILLAIASVAGIVALVPPRQTGEEAKPVPPVDVETTRVNAIRDFPDTFELSGHVDADRIVDVSAEVAGHVVEIYCEEGRPCDKGALLLQLDREILKAERDRLAAQNALNEAELIRAAAQDSANAADVKRARAQRNFDEAEYKRILASAAREVATEVEVQQAKTKLEASEAALAAAQARAEAGAATVSGARSAIKANAAMLLAAQTRLDRTTIKAPISGKLHHLPVEEGSYVRSGDHVARIVDLDPAKVVVEVSEQDIRYLRLGDKGQVIIDQRRRQAVSGTISYIAALADDVTRTTRVELSMANRDATSYPATVEGADGEAAVIAVDVPEPSLPYFDVRGAVKVTADGANGEAAAGSVRSVEPEADAETGTTRVTIAAANAELKLEAGQAVHVRSTDHLLHDGHIVRVRLTRAILPKAILVPLKAIIPGETTRIAYVVEDGRAVRRDNLELGFFKGANVQVLRGLKEGEELIVSGQQFVGPGDRVKVIRRIEGEQP
jgi:multidrug efflux system membrane fusion protein